MWYNPALDGLRALAITLVVLLHCHVPLFWRGHVGVDLFFVLSGFLITRLLLTERERTGRIDLIAFYARRARRLYPALLLMLAAYLVVAPIWWPDTPHTRDALLTGLYLTDYSYAFWQMPKYLLHTWTLGIEEKFYLLWPAVLMSLRGTLSRKIAWGMLVAWAWMVTNWIFGLPLGRFDTYLLGLLAGCWLATTDITLPKKHAFFGGLVFLVLAMIPALNFPWLPLGEVAGVLLVMAAVKHQRCPAWAAWIGKLSYGIYLWHFPLAKAITAPSLLEFSVVASLSVLLSWVSYVTVERWLRRRRGDTERGHGSLQRDMAA